MNVNDALPQPPLRPLLTLGEFIRVVPVSRPTLTRLIDTGQLRAVRIGRRLFFAPDEVERFLRSCSAEGPGR